MQLLLELDFCWRNSASAKVYNFRWNCFFAAPPRRRLANGQTAASAIDAAASLCGAIIMSESVTRDAQRRVFGVVQGLLEGDKDSSPSVQNDRVFRLTMTGLEPLAARPIGASVIDAALPPGSWPVIACPYIGADRRPAFRPPSRSRSSARMNWRERKKFPVRAALAEPFIRQDELARAQKIPGQGRARAGVRRSRTAASATDAAASLCGAIIMSESVTRDAQRRVFGVVQGLLEGDKDSSPSVQNDRVFRLTMTGLEPLAARPIGASVIDAALPPGSWPVIACPYIGADRRPAFRPPSRSRSSARMNWRERKKFPVRAALAEPFIRKAKLPRAQITRGVTACA